MPRGILGKMTYSRGVASNTWLRVLDDGGATVRPGSGASDSTGESCWGGGDKALGGNGFRFTEGE